MTTTIAGLQPDHLTALRRFLDALPDGDVTFFKEDVRDPAVAEGWARRPGATRMAVAMDESASLGARHRTAGDDVLLQFQDGVLLAR